MVSERTVSIRTIECWLLWLKGLALIVVGFFVHLSLLSYLGLFSAALAAVCTIRAMLERHSAEYREAIMLSQDVERVRRVR